jgi:hypothetical protein
MIFSLVQNNSSTSHHHRRHRSPTPPPSSSRVRSPPDEHKNESISNSKVNPQEELTNTQTSLNESSKRRHRWENEEDLNDRQQANVEDESRLISQTNTAQIESNANIPPQAEEPTTNANKSKWDDDDDDETTTDSVQQNQTQPES